MSNQKGVNRLNAERRRTGSRPPPEDDITQPDPEIFMNPDEQMRLKLGLMDFPDIFVPPPDIPPIAPAAAAAGSCRTGPTATQTSGKENIYFYSFNRHVKKI